MVYFILYKIFVYTTRKQFFVVILQSTYCHTRDLYMYIYSYPCKIHHWPLLLPIFFNCMSHMYRYLVYFYLIEHLHKTCAVNESAYNYFIVCIYHTLLCVYITPCCVYTVYRNFHLCRLSKTRCMFPLYSASLFQAKSWQAEVKRG